MNYNMKKEDIIKYLQQLLHKVLPNSPQMVAIYEAINIIEKSDINERKEDA